MLAVGLIALGLALLARALPPSLVRRWAGDARAVGLALGLVLAGGIAALAARHEPASPGAPAGRASQTGVCADAGLQAACRALHEAAEPALRVLAGLPLDAGASRGQLQLIQPGRGDVYLAQTVTTTQSPAEAVARLDVALRAAGWQPLADPGDLRRYRSGTLVAVVRAEPAGSGVRIQLVVTRG